MGGIGIVNNPRSRRNRRSPALRGRLSSLLGADGELVDASTPDELSVAVDRLRNAAIDVLGVNGGDGTGHHVLTAFARAYGEAPLPPLLLLRGGSMNTVAHGHGIRGGPERILRDVLLRRRHGAPMRTVSRDLLRITGDDGPPRYGFIFGTGAIATFIEAYDRSGASPGTALRLLARAIGSTLLGGPFAASLARRQPLRVATDGDEWADVGYLAVAAGSTPDIGFGFLAFNRCAEQPGFFHAVGVTGPPGVLARALFRLWRGAPYRRRVAQDEVARELVVEGDGISYIIDGDLYRAERTVRVETGPAVEIVLP
jgi:diacylglycerol kinase family enzyme